uniref:Transposase Tnp1/En/Spm-like domain-containing protein n=1 Tax=Noccaea caerulescens TaxID=107243 RepID=A0A1J3FJP9_NOCCA
MAGTKRTRSKRAKKIKQVTAEVVEEQPELGDNGLVEDQQNNAELQSAQEELHREDEEELDREVEEEPEGEIELSEHDEAGAERSRKRQRGPTRMKDIAKDPNNKIRVQFTFSGDPYGSGSVKLSSYLGLLVREHVPVTLTSWTKLSEAMKTVLWKSVHARFELDEDYQRKAVLKQCGCLWRSSKSRLATQILEATNNQQRMNLRPKNVSPIDWRKFVKLKTSQEFKAVSDSYKERRRKQIPHTCSRKGMVRLAEEMKCVSENPSEVTRLKVWVKSRTRKDGTPVNTNAADKMKKAAEMVHSDTPNSATNEGEDTLTQLLGPDNPGRMRVMGRNMTKTKLACFEVKHKCMIEMQQKQFHLQQKVNELQEEIANMKNQREEPEVGENSAAKISLDYDSIEVIFIHIQREETDI